MLIVNDTGTDMVNSENVIGFGIGKTNEGLHAAIAYGAGVNTVLAVGSEDRCLKALDAIRRKWRNPEVLDLRDALGGRPNLAVAQAIPINGQRGS